MLLALEAEDAGKVKLSDQVTISERAASMGGSQMYMEPGEVHTLEELRRMTIELCRIQQRFGGNAAFVQANAAKRALFKQANLKSALRSAFRSQEIGSLQ